MYHPHTRYLADEAATLTLGEEVATWLHPGLVIFLNGDLGAGKTTLTRGILHKLGFHGRVKSPTYNLVETYPFPLMTVFHFDFYRFNNPLEWEEAGFREYFNASSVCIVEWPVRAQGLLPVADLTITLTTASEAGRHAHILAETMAGHQCLQSCQHPQTPGSSYFQ